jgi:hypothetical protein
VYIFTIIKYGVARGEVTRGSEKREKAEEMWKKMGKGEKQWLSAVISHRQTYLIDLLRFAILHFVSLRWLRTEVGLVRFEPGPAQ